MRPRAPEAENHAYLSIVDQSSYFDGGCTFESEHGEPVPIPSDMSGILRAIDDYVSFFPKSDLVSTMLYRKASLLMECRHHDAAAQIYRTIYEKFPDTELAELSRTRHADAMQMRDAK